MTEITSGFSPLRIEDRTIFEKSIFVESTYALRSDLTALPPKRKAASNIDTGSAPYFLQDPVEIFAIYKFLLFTYEKWTHMLEIMSTGNF